ncbi:MAG: DsrE/DsrF/DrsH-like family protein [Thermoplasmatota archaeon]
MKKTNQNQNLRLQYKKTMKRDIPKKMHTISIIITEDTYDKALTAFNIAVSAVEMGTQVEMFFTARGINILKKSYKPRKSRWGEAPIGWKESFIKRRGGATLAQLLYQAKDMGVIMNVCYTSMISMGLKTNNFIDGSIIKRMPEFLQKTQGSDAHFVIG